MRTGCLSTVQQTLTEEASAVLNQSIADAGRRNHSQTTPLHVAATLLASPTGFLRQACIRSHPNSSHPLQCRALELCFSVALDRLPTTQNTVAEPPISNALMAALKRAQAHQRRGCPEQQQQPLLAVKVELEQLILSILDDPSVSRVMRQASFSSSAVKANIEQSLNNSSTYSQHQLAGRNVSFAGIGPPRVIPNPIQLLPPVNPSPLFPPVNQSQLLSPPTMVTAMPNRNIYLNSRLQQGVTRSINNQYGEDVRKVLEIMGRSKKKNPVLVGDSEPETVLKELLKKIANKELDNNGVFRNPQVLSVEKELDKIAELGALIETKINYGGVILDLGDLKWFVEHLPGATAPVSDTGKAAVAELTKLLRKFNGGDFSGNRVWLIATATCQTYLRCQVHHPTVETGLDLQAFPIASGSPSQITFPRVAREKARNSPLEALNLLKTHQMKPVLRPQRSDLCPQCTENYEKELKKLTELEKSFSEASSKRALPQWLQSATFDAKLVDEGKDQGLLSNHKVQDLQKKWRDTCLHLHSDFHRNAHSTIESWSPNLLLCPPFQSKSQLNGGAPAPQLNMNQLLGTPPEYPVGTELALGRKSSDSGVEDYTMDFLGCISSESKTKQLDKFANGFDAEGYKKLHKELMEKAWWQPQAATAVASAITKFRFQQFKMQGGVSRGDLWLLFTGPERVGKKKIASVISQQICGTSPIVISLGKRRDDEELETNYWGKTAIDRIAEAVRKNPFSLIMLEDIDEADMLVRGSIKRATERGRLIDSHGREVCFGNSIIIVTGDWLKIDQEAVIGCQFVDAKRLATVAGGNWQLGLILRDRGAKRRTSWMLDEERPSKLRNEMGLGSSISLDLNLAAGSCTEDDRTNGSFNSSEVTIDQDDELIPQEAHFITCVPQELANHMDESIVFRPVESSFVRQEIKKRISTKFTTIVDEKLSIEIGDDVLEKILGGVWHDRTSLDEWIENVVELSFEELKSQLPPIGDRSRTVVRMVAESDSCNRGKMKGTADWLPKSILV